MGRRTGGRTEDWAVRTETEEAGADTGVCWGAKDLIAREARDNFLAPQPNLSNRLSARG